MQSGELRHPGSILLLSCYELGHPPLGLAWPASFLRQAGFDPVCRDTSLEGVDDETIARAGLVAISVPMHTALRLGTSLARRVRHLNPECHITFFGLYAILNAEHLLATLADSIIGGEYEQPLVELASALDSASEAPVAGVARRAMPARPHLQRIPFVPADYSALPSIERYCKLQRGNELLPAGYVEASRGCKHLCLHCPIPPVYNGRFFVVPKAVVRQQVRDLVEKGARHITFGDPDFLNGPRHSKELVEEIHEEFPGLTFDCTAKVEHLVKYPELLKAFARCGCIFIVSAVESLNDTVLNNLKKGHTRDDFFRALSYVRNCGIRLRPTFVSFTPWTTLSDYLEVLDTVEAEQLLDCVDPIQFAIRLLVPPGSPLLSEKSMRPHLRGLLPDRYTWSWIHPDPRMDHLQREVSGLVERAAGVSEDPLCTFAGIRELANAAYEERPSDLTALTPPPFIVRPLRLTEPWFC